MCLSLNLTVYTVYAAQVCVCVCLCGCKGDVGGKSVRWQVCVVCINVPDCLCAGVLLLLLVLF